MDIKRLKDRKRELNYTNAMIAERSGVPLGTVQKIFSGATASPRYSTLEALEKVLFPKTDASVVREEAFVYSADAGKEREWPRQGSYTLEDYYAIPDDIRVELIDGYIYNMNSPSIKHQAIIGKLYLLFVHCINEHCADCRVFLSPLDVRLDCDNRTMVEPDLIVLCRKPGDERRIEGAPDLLVEVLSPSTRQKDCLLKLNKYMNAGVREYWIVDPETERVMVYRFKEDPLPRQYSFSDMIPIGISDGKCQIDFSEVKKDIESL